MKKKRLSDTGKDVKVAERLGEKFDFRKAFPAAEQFCDPFFQEFAAVDSSNLTPLDWSMLAQRLGDDWGNYDAFVILQGTDTLAFTAAALSFAMRYPDKPVILTGAQLELDAPGSDAHSNVINALRAAALKNGSQSAIKGPAVVFGSRIILGTRCRKHSERDLEAFQSVNVPDLGTFRLSVQLNAATRDWNDQPRCVGQHQFHVAKGFDSHVVLLHVFPGMKPDLLSAIGKRCSGIVVAGYGAGNIPCSTPGRENELSLEPAISELVNMGIPVGITTQCVIGQAEMGMYETGTAAQRAGAMILNDMIPETAFVKLSWLLANESEWPTDAKRAMRGGPGRMAALRKAMLTNLAGEITENQSLFGLYTAM